MTTAQLRFEPFTLTDELLSLHKREYGSDWGPGVVSDITPSPVILAKVHEQFAVLFPHLRFQDVAGNFKFHNPIRVGDNLESLCNVEEKGDEVTVNVKVSSKGILAYEINVQYRLGKSTEQPQLFSGALTDNGKTKLFFEDLKKEIFFVFPEYTITRESLLNHYAIYSPNLSERNLKELIESGICDSRIIGSIVAGQMGARYFCNYYAGRSLDYKKFKPFKIGDEFMTHSEIIETLKPLEGRNVGIARIKQSTINIVTHEVHYERIIKLFVYKKP